MQIINNFPKDRENILKFKSQKTTLLTIDWLTLNVEDVFQYFKFDEDNFFTDNELTYELIEGQRTRHFNKSIKVYSQGVFFATITCSSNNAVILKNRSHIKFENSLFYDGSIEFLAKKNCL